MRYLSVEPNPPKPVRSTLGGNTPLIREIFQKLYRAFGPQHWWPAETPFEVIVGAVLTQNTAWRNVQSAIANLKSQNLLDPEAIATVSPAQLAAAIRPAGYYNIKAKRLKALVGWLMENGGLENIKQLPTRVLRTRLLNCYGVGRETADSILLYAFNRPVFVIDTYTRRILGRYGLISGDESYEELRDWIEKCLTAGMRKNSPRITRIFNEFHALLVRLAKIHCRTKPICLNCPLGSD